MRRFLTVVLAISAALALATGCDSGKSSQNGAQAPSVPSSSPTVPPTSPGSSSPTPSASASSSASPTPSTSTSPAAPQKLKVGTKGATVLALQQRLTALGYWNGKADGKFGGTTQQAVFALQKAAGLGRDGVVGPKTQKALDRGVRPTPKSTAGSGHLIEINLAKQLLMIVDNGRVTTILNTSTGSNQHYEYQNQTHLADTPSGHFRVGRQIDGWRHGPLGPLWRPKYFNGGIAVHGAPSVPPYPASHGCARVSVSAMNWIWSADKIPLNTKVWVYRA